MPSRLRSSSPWDSSLKKTPPRTSATMARRDGPPAPPPSSAIFPISAGGRLSTTKYPRSSRHFAASERPAPDRPVITVKSTISWLWLRLGFRPVVVATSARPSFPGLGGWAAVEPLVDRPGHGRPQSGGGLQLLDGGRPEAGNRTEPLQQGPLAGGPDPWDVVELGVQGALRPFLPVIGDGEAVGLVPDVLQHEQRLGPPGDDQRLRLAGQVDLLQPLGQADGRDLHPPV